jgi:hypothetical protein
MQRQTREEIVELQEDLRQSTERVSEVAILESKATTEAHVALAALTRANDHVAILEKETESIKVQAKLRLQSEQASYQAEIDQLRLRITQNIQEASDKISQLTDDLSHVRNEYAEAVSEVSALKIQMQQR